MRIDLPPFARVAGITPSGINCDDSCTAIPKISAPSLINSGLLNRRGMSETLSAPERNTARKYLPMSANLRHRERNENFVSHPPDQSGNDVALV